MDRDIDIPKQISGVRLIDNLEPGDVDWIALHGYGRGSLGQTRAMMRNLVNFPLDWQFFGFRMWQPFADILRQKGPEWERLANCYYRNQSSEGWWDMEW